MRRAAQSKYRAKPTTVDGIRFHSQKEARRYGELKLLEKAGKLHRLAVQPGFPLAVQKNGSALPTKIGEYRADFIYCECNARSCAWGDTVVEDVKGFRTPLYRWKKKHVEAQYGITIVEI